MSWRRRWIARDSRSPAAAKNRGPRSVRKRAPDGCLTDRLRTPKITPRRDEPKAERTLDAPAHHQPKPNLTTAHGARWALEPQPPSAATSRLIPTSSGIGGRLRRRPQEEIMTDTPDYRDMWTELGLDLDNHDALLGVLGALYGDTYLNQKNRPAGMGYFDFVMSEVHGLRIKELVDARAAGRIVVGAFCVFVPEELVLAVDGVCVGLCAGADFGTEPAERYLPRNTCALIKSFFGFALEKVCPYLAGLRPGGGREHLRRQEEGLRDLRRHGAGRVRGARHAEHQERRGPGGAQAGLSRSRADPRAAVGHGHHRRGPQGRHRDRQPETSGAAPARGAAPRRAGAHQRSRRPARQPDRPSTTTRSASRRR